MTWIPNTRYAHAPDGTYLAYRTFGEGPVDLIAQLDWMGNVDVLPDMVPDNAAAFQSLSRFARSIWFDRRGTGLSSRNVPPPNLETSVADCQVVMDAVGLQRPVLFGFQAGGATQALFAATEPERTQAFVWLNPAARSVWAPDYPWGVGPEYVERFEQAILEHWGSNELGRAFNEVERLASGSSGHIGTDPDELVGLLSRHTATPDVALELQRNWYQTDVRAILPTVGVPTLLLSHGPDHSQAEYIRSLMPTAELITFTSDRDRPALHDWDAFWDRMRVWLGVPAPVEEGDSILATVLFTDIVDSTSRQASRGDRAWKELAERHHAIVRQELDRWRGSEVDTAGDGFYATFDGPARAIRCAVGIVERIRDLGIEVRAGVHTGECEVIDGKIGGLSVTIGARVAATAGPSEVRISQTVKDLTAGSGLVFEDAGDHDLKGVPDRWHLYRVVDG